MKHGELPQIPRRPYGKTGIELSIIGLGGMAVANADPRTASRLVGQAIDRGVNYFDVAPTYHDAEAVLGPALRPFRDDVFLACKTTQRTRTGAEKELKASLARLQTDHLDLYQFHALADVRKDVDVIFAAGGAMELFQQARKDGRVRHIGFSAHTAEAALAAMDRYDFDSILFPVNFAAWLKNGFGTRVLRTAAKRGAACLALKALARQKWPANDPNRRKYPKCWYQPLTDAAEASMALRWTLSQPITAAIPPGEEPLLRLAMETAAAFRPITGEEEIALKTLARTLDPLFP